MQHPRPHRLLAALLAATWAFTLASASVAAAAPPDARRDAIVARLDRLRAKLLARAPDERALDALERGLEVLERAADRAGGPDGACFARASRVLRDAGYLPQTALERAADACRGSLSPGVFDAALTALLGAGYLPPTAIERARQTAEGPSDPARAEAFTLALRELTAAGYLPATAISMARDLTLEISGGDATCFRTVLDASTSYLAPTRLELARDRCR